MAPLQLRTYPGRRAKAAAASQTCLSDFFGGTPGKHLCIELPTPPKPKRRRCAVAKQEKLEDVPASTDLLQFFKQSELLDTPCKVARPGRPVYSQVEVHDDDWLEKTWPSQRILCRSTCSEVHVVKDLRTNEVRVLKKVRKQAVSMFFDRKGSALSFRDEAEVMKSLPSSDAVCLFEYFETEVWFCMVLEYVEGGSLFEQLKPKGMDEAEAKRMLRLLALAVRGLHDIGVVHRDLKPENVLLTSKSIAEARVKLADFGISRRLQLNQNCTTFVGTTVYIAPEVWAVDRRRQKAAVPASGSPLKTRAGYGKEADLWSLGVILFTMLCGELPFDPWNDHQELSTDVLEGRWHFGETWKRVSDEAKDVVRGLLTVKPSRRMTMDALLQHPWLKDDG